MKFAVTLASALALHAAAAVGASAIGVLHGVATEPALRSRAATIEVDEVTVPEEREVLPVANVASVAHESSRGTPNPIHVLSRAAATSDALPAPPPTVSPESTHFKMTVSSGAAAPSAPDAARHASASSEEIVADDAVTVRAQKIDGAQPTYPPDAVAQGVELGAPLPFEIVVDTSGHVASVHSLHHAGYGFDEAALTALRTFRFSPATRDGHRVNVRMRWTVEFKFN